MANKIPDELVQPILDALKGIHNNAVSLTAAAARIHGDNDDKMEEIIEALSSCAALSASIDLYNQLLESNEQSEK